MKTIVCIWLALIGSIVPAAAQPSPPPSPDVPVSLNSRIFLNTAGVYDPTYGLGRVGIISNRVFTIMNTNLDKTDIKPPQVMRNFPVYDYTFKGGASGGINIPVIGSASVGSTQMMHITMLDMVEVFLPRAAVPSVCTIWKALSGQQIPPNSTIVFTDHAILSKMTYAAGDKQDASAKIGIGSYFSAGGDTFKDASSMTSTPLISVDGGQFTVVNPKTFCTPAAAHAPAHLTPFKDLTELKLAKGHQPQTLDAELHLQ